MINNLGTTIISAPKERGLGRLFLRPINAMAASAVALGSASALSYHILTNAPTVSGLLALLGIGISVGVGIGKGISLALGNLFLKSEVKQKNMEIEQMNREAEEAQVVLAAAKEEALKMSAGDKQLSIKRDRRKLLISEFNNLVAQIKSLEHSFSSFTQEERVRATKSLGLFRSQLKAKEAEIAIIEGELVDSGPIRPIKLLGEGGMGSAFLCYSLGLDAPVVVKTVLKKGTHISTELGKRLGQEAESMAKIVHPNVARIYTLTTWQKQQALVMEYINGKTAAEYLDKEGVGFGRYWGIKIALMLAEGLQAAHENKVIHRDIKSENVMLTFADDIVSGAKFIDFGLARNVVDDTKPRVTMDGISAGTIEYMPPEQCYGLTSTVAASDVYSLAILIYELVTGKVPYLEGLNPNADVSTRMIYFIKKAKEENLPPLVQDDTNDPLYLLLKGMTREKAENRPGIAKVVEELKQLEAQLNR